MFGTSDSFKFPCSSEVKLQVLEVYKSQLTAAEAESEEQAVAIIQAALRGRQGRQVFDREYYDLDDAAMTLQAGIRGREGRVMTYVASEREAEISAMFVKQDAADSVVLTQVPSPEAMPDAKHITTVQAGLRGMQERRAVRQRLKNNARLQRRVERAWRHPPKLGSTASREEQAHAAHVISGVLLGHKARQEVHDALQTKAEKELRELNAKLAEVKAKLQRQKRGTLDWAELKVSETSLQRAVGQKNAQVQAEKVVQDELLAQQLQEERGEKQEVALEADNSAKEEALQKKDEEEMEAQTAANEAEKARLEADHAAKQAALDEENQREEQALLAQQEAEKREAIQKQLNADQQAALEACQAAERAALEAENRAEEQQLQREAAAEEARLAQQRQTEEATMLAKQEAEEAALQVESEAKERRLHEENAAQEAAAVEVTRLCEEHARATAAAARQAELDAVRAGEEAAEKRIQEAGEEAAREKAEAEAAEAARLKAQEEAEAARKKADEDAAQGNAEAAESARLAAEAEATRVKAEVNAAREAAEAKAAEAANEAALKEAMELKHREEELEREKAEAKAAAEEAARARLEAERAKKAKTEQGRAEKQAAAEAAFEKKKADKVAAEKAKAMKLAALSPRSAAASESPNPFLSPSPGARSPTPSFLSPNRLREQELASLNHDYFCLNLEVLKGNETPQKQASMKEDLARIETQIDRLQRHYSEECERDARLIQGGIAGRQARADVGTALAKEDAAFVIQAGLAGRGVRVDAAGWELEELEEETAQEVPADELTMEAVASLTLEELHHQLATGEAAAPIQGAVRGQEGRRAYRQREEQDAAAYVLQSGIRGGSSRRDFEAMPKFSQVEYDLEDLRASLVTIQAGLKSHRRGSLEWAKLKVTEAQMESTIEGKEQELQMERINAARGMVGAGKTSKKQTAAEELEEIEKVIALLGDELEVAGTPSQKEAITAMIGEMESIVLHKIELKAAQTEAALAMQAGMKGYSARKDVAAIEEAASVIQNAVQGHVVRLQNDDLLRMDRARSGSRIELDNALSELDELNQDIKAVHLKGYNPGRKAQLAGKKTRIEDTIKQLKEQVQTESDSAACIQGIMRGSQSRQEVARLTEMGASARVIQSAIRTSVRQQEMQGLHYPTEAEDCLEVLNGDLIAVQEELLGSRKLRKKDPAAYEAIQGREADLQLAIDVAYSAVHAERDVMYQAEQAERAAAARVVQGAVAGRAARREATRLLGVTELDLEVLNDELFSMKMEILARPKTPRSKQVASRVKVVQVAYTSAQEIFKQSQEAGRDCSARVIQAAIRARMDRELAPGLAEADNGLSESEIELAAWEVELESKREKLAQTPEHDENYPDLEGEVETIERTITAKKAVIEAQESAARVIQAGVRGHSHGRVVAQRYEAQIEVAPVLQAGFRGMQSRRKRYILPAVSVVALEGLNEALAATQRDLLQKKKGSVEWAEALIAEATMQEEIAGQLEEIQAERAAATTIQAGVTSYAARRTVEELRALNVAQDRASELILGGVHGAQARLDVTRLEMQNQEEAAYPIQGMMRGRLSRREALGLRERDDAALVIQSGIRGKVGRREAFSQGPGPALKEKLSLLEADLSTGATIVDLARQQLRLAEDELDLAMASGEDEAIEAAEEALTVAMDNLADEMKALATSRHKRRASMGDALRDPNGNLFGFGSPDASPRSPGLVGPPSAVETPVGSIISPGSPTSSRKSLQQQNEDLFEELTVAREEADRIQGERDKLAQKFERSVKKANKANEALLEYQMKDVQVKKKERDDATDFWGNPVNKPAATAEEDADLSPKTPTAGVRSRANTTVEDESVLQVKLEASNKQLLEAQFEIMRLTAEGTKGTKTSDRAEETQLQIKLKRSNRELAQAREQLDYLKVKVEEGDIDAQRELSQQQEEEIARARKAAEASQRQLAASELKCEELKGEVDTLKEGLKETAELRGRVEQASLEREELRAAAEREAAELAKVMQALHQETVGGLRVELLDSERCITKEALARREKELEETVASQYRENLALREQASTEAKAQLEEAEARCKSLAAEVDALSGTKEEIQAERDTLEEKLKRSQARAMQANQALLDAQMTNVKAGEEKRESWLG